jgi:hypothetical protein
MRFIFLLPFLASLVSSAVLAEEVYHNVASRDSLFRADRLGRMMNALTLHREFDDKCNLVPLIDIEAFNNYYEKLTWSLSPSDLELVRKHYSDAQTTWSAEGGGVPASECDQLSYEILDFDIGIPNPRDLLMSLLNSTPRASSEYKIYAAATAWGGYIQTFMSCSNFYISTKELGKIERSNGDDFRVPHYLARMSAVKTPPSCMDIEPFAREGGVYRAKSK